MSRCGPYHRPVRRPDPARIHAAQRAGLHGRMVSSWRVAPERADELLEAWAREAEVRGLAPGDRDYWSLGEPWLRERAETM